MDKKIIHSVFEHTVRRFPKNTAVDEGSRSVTYRGLNAYANRVAHALAELGAGRHSVVGMYFEASIEYIMAVLGVLKCGAVFMPLDTRFPEKRLASIVNKTKPDIFIIGPALENRFSLKLQQLDFSLDTGHRVAFDDGFNFTIKVMPNGTPVADSRDFPDKNPPLRTRPDDGCYIITTSASTGQPKAILGCQNGLSHFIHWEIAEFGLDQDMRVTLLSPLTFDVSLRDIFVPLSVGGTLCIPDGETRHRPGKLFDWMRDSGITLTHIVPTSFRLVTREIEDSGTGEDALPNLKYALIAGEALYGDDVIKWRRATGNHIELVNLYGPSETILAKLFYRIRDKNFAPGEIVPIGKPIPDTEVLIMKNDKLCPVGETGEIYIKTPFMSKGYYNDPKLNEMSFVRNPLVSDRKDILYKTGDLGKFMPDGNVRFEGRLDTQIKLYGMRIEIGEIEAVLRQHPQVRQTAVAARPDSFGNTRLVGYVVPQPGQKPAVESLRRSAGDNLPDYMVPSVFVTLKALPLTHNGKINRGALPEPDGRRPEMEQAYVSPSTALERNLTEMWRHVLDLNRVGVHDNFFDLGGTSILAVKIAALMQKTFDIEVPIVKLFQYPSISLLTNYLTQTQSHQPTYEMFEDRAQTRRAAFSRKKRPKVNN